MKIDLTEDQIVDLIGTLEMFDGERGADHSDILALLQETIECEAQVLAQEVWVKCSFNGYFYSFRDQMIQVEIQIPNPNYGQDDRFTGTTKIFTPINADAEGKVNLNPLFHTFLQEMKDNPDKEVKAYATGFTRQFHFDANLLNTPIPQSLLDLFKIPKENVMRAHAECRFQSEL